jgi:cytochrome c peroxidase
MKPRAAVFALSVLLAAPAHAQLRDVTQAPNAANEGIRKSLTEQTGPGRGDWTTPGSSSFVIARDAFRAIRRGRQLFQRKFTMAQGVGPTTLDGNGEIGEDGSIGAGLADSCAACHGRPRGSAGFGGDVFTRPDSRDAPHLFGLGLVEMLGDEITTDLRAIRARARAAAQTSGHDVTLALRSKGIAYGRITARPDGTVDTAGVVGVDADLRVKPFFHQGETFSIREFVAGALNAEMGLEAPDADILAASAGGRVVTPAGMVLDGRLDVVLPPAALPGQDNDGDGHVDEIDTAIVDYLEFYLLNYFKPALGRQTNHNAQGFNILAQIGCTTCHVRDLTIQRDRRVADVETVYDPVRGIFNSLFATAAPLMTPQDDGSGHPPVMVPNRQPFVVRNVFADFRRHDLGPAFWERNFNGTIRKLFMTEPLWGVASTGPYGHDGRSMTLRDVILRHGGEAQAARDNFAALPEPLKDRVLGALGSLVLFPPDDTASNLNPGDPTDPLFPQRGHGSIALSGLFVDPLDLE